jgi:hypothetical protein
MNAMRKLLRYVVGGLAALLVCGSVSGWAQNPSDAPPPGNNTAPENGAATSAGSPARGRHRGGEEDGPRPVFGRIASIQNGTMKITRPDGSQTTIKFTNKTEFRKDREPAVLKDFQVGDGVVIRGEENPDFSVTAQMVAGRNGNGGPAGGPNRQNPVGTLGKDFIVGQVKAIDAPGLTVMRTDNVTQSFELNEDTSLRKGRDSITMADIQVGDHVFARGAMQQDQFLPKSVTIISPEAWKRMQDAGLTTPAAGRATQSVPPPNGKPAEPQN